MAYTKQKPAHPGFIVLDERGVSLCLDSSPRRNRNERPVLVITSEAMTVFRNPQQAKKAIASTRVWATAEKFPWVDDIPKWSVVPVTILKNEG